MPFPLAGIIGGMLASRLGFAVASTSGGIAKTFLRSPLIQGGQFGVGYTGGAYLGYGGTNTADPFGIHKPKYSSKQQSLGLPGYGYGYRYRGYRYRRGRYRYRRRPAYRTYRRSYY